VKARDEDRRTTNAPETGLTKINAWPSTVISGPREMLEEQLRRSRAGC
jgi:hypothetical protein